MTDTTRLIPDLMAPRVRDMSHVRRWAIVPTITSQTLTDHSYYVALYATQICGMLDLPVTTALLVHCLVHDMDELTTGDIPTPAKQYMNAPTPICDGSREFLPLVYKRVVKVADLLDATLFLIDEQGLGNRKVQAALIKTIQSLKLHATELGIKNQILEVVRQHYAYEGRDK